MLVRFGAAVGLRVEVLRLSLSDKLRMKVIPRLWFRRFRVQEISVEEILVCPQV
jgi:hypothetical protein